MERERNTTPEEQRAEAVKRLEALGVFSGVIDGYRDRGQIMETDNRDILGACYDINEEQAARVKEFEEEHNAAVFHVVHGLYLIAGEEQMEMESFLFVSDYPEEWKDDRERLKDGEALAWVYNATIPEFSEIGWITVEVNPAGGLKRVF